MGMTTRALYGEPSDPTPNKPTMVVDTANDFGFTTVERIEDDRVSVVMKRVFAFLDKLAENPERDIHWPNRDKKIEEFKLELLAILDKKD